MDSEDGCWGQKNIDGLDWVDEDEIDRRGKITDIRQLEAFGVTDQSL